MASIFHPREALDTGIMTICFRLKIGGWLNTIYTLTSSADQNLNSQWINVQKCKKKTFNIVKKLYTEVKYLKRLLSRLKTIDDF